MSTFGTAGIRGDVLEEVTPEVALAVGRAVGRDAGSDAFVLGRDGRETGEALADAVASGLESAGGDVIRVGCVPTPALAYASLGRHGVMVTASHNPPTDNGIKLFADGVEYDRVAERRVEEGIATDAGPVAWDGWGGGSRTEVIDRYVGAVVDYASDHGAPLDGLPVAVDCGNGMAGTATPQVLRGLDADVVALNANVDGHFPARGSKPTPDSLSDLRSFVRDGEFAVGIGHDGDADRIAVVDGSGEMVHEDTVVAILARYYVESSDGDDPVVVTTPNASARIDERVAAAGGRTERVRLGALHEGVADVRDVGGQVVFAAEPWKHIHPTFGGWIDGVVSAALLARLISGAGGLSNLREHIDERPYRKENVACPDRLKDAVVTDLERRLPEHFPDAEVDTEYGIRIDRPDGSWVLVRASGTEPYLRVYVESEDVDDLVETTVSIVEEAVQRAESRI